MKDSPELTSRYELDRVLSWQGPTRTYRALDPVSGETVALKAISLGTVPEAQVLKQRFLATAGVLRSLDHPNLPRLLDFGVTGDAEAYLVFEWIEGTTLDRTGDLAPRQVLSYVLQAIEGLETLALHGLVHLNLAPENLMVTNEGEIKLLGLGGSLLRVDWQSPMAHGGLPGVAGITAPELQHHASAGSALWRADLYALAFVTCALLGAEVDGAGTASPEVRFPEEVAAQLHAPDQLAKALARCLHIEPSQRPVSYSNLGKVLQHSLPRAPRAEAVVRDTQVFDVGELAARELSSPAPAMLRPGAAGGATEDPGAGSLSDGESGRPEATEILTLRSDLEASLGNGDLKEPADLGKEAEIYEGFLELRDDSAPVEIDLAAAREQRGAPPPRGAATNGRPAEGNETVLAQQVSSPVTPERPAAPPGAQTVLTAVPREAEHPPEPPPSPPRPPVVPAQPAADVPMGRRTEMPTERLVAPPPPPAPSKKAPARPSPAAPRPKAPVTAAAAPAAAPSPRPVPPSAPPAVPPRPAAPSKPAAPPKPPGGSRSRRGETVRPGTDARAVARGAAEPAVVASSPARAASATPKRMASAAVAKKTARSSGLLKGIAAIPKGVSARSGGKDRRVLVTAGIVAFVAVSSLATVLLWPGGSAAPEPAVAVSEMPSPLPEPQPAEPEPAPPAALPEPLQQAVALLDEGKLLEARDRLEEVAGMEEEGALDQAALEAYRALEEIILRQRAESVVDGLSAALKAGDQNRLRQTLSGVTAAEDEALSGSSQGRQLLADARRAREQLDTFQRSLADGDRMEALNAAFRLAESFPAFDSALRSRERATAAVEAEVDSMIEQGRLEEAEDRLVLLKSMWPDRPGIDGKLDTVHQRMESEARFDTLLAAAKAAGERGRPHEGLRLLDSARPKREYVDRFDRERGVLEEQMRRLDAGTPVVRVRSGEIEYRKGSPVVVELEAEDDYQVAGVTCWIRNTSQSDYTAIEATRVDGGLYRVEVDAALHEDKTLRFWASVRDLSGHEGRLGSAEAPVEVKRKRWFR